MNSNMTPEQQRLHDAVIKELIDRGKLIEAGFAGLRIMAMHPESPPGQVHDMKMAFMAGAQHLWGSIMTVLDPGEEPTVEDMRRLELISKELDEYAKELDLHVTPAEGTG